MSYIIRTQYDCSFTPVLSMCIMGAFNYMVIYYFCHKTPALIRWQYSAASWLTFCFPSKLQIVISSANIQTLLLLTLSHRLLLTNYLCFVTKQNTKNQHPTSALFPNKFIHCTDYTKGFRVISLCHYLCIYSASPEAMRLQILELQPVSEAWRAVSEMPNSHPILETSCHTSTSASLFFSVPNYVSIPAVCPKLKRFRSVPLPFLNNPLISLQLLNNF